MRCVHRCEGVSVFLSNREPNGVGTLVRAQRNDSGNATSFFHNVLFFPAKISRAEKHSFFHTARPLFAFYQRHLFSKIFPGITYDTVFPWMHLERSSVLFTELDRRLSVSKNNQNKRKYKEENKKCRKNRQREKQRDFDKRNNKMFSPLQFWGQEKKLFLVVC